jgi:hypothetical protein
MEAKGTTVVSGGKDQKSTPKVDTSEKKRYKRLVDFEPKIQSEEPKLVHSSMWTVAKKHPTLGYKVVKRYDSQAGATAHVNQSPDKNNLRVIKPSSEMFKSKLTSADFTPKWKD